MLSLVACWMILITIRSQLHSTLIDQLRVPLSTKYSVCSFESIMVVIFILYLLNIINSNKLLYLVDYNYSFVFLWIFVLFCTCAKFTHETIDRLFCPADYVIEITLLLWFRKFGFFSSKIEIVKCFKKCLEVRSLIILRKWPWLSWGIRLFSNQWSQKYCNNI